MDTAGASPESVRDGEGALIIDVHAIKFGVLRLLESKTKYKWLFV